MPILNPPASLVAELTHRCPLHCVYCSNPIEMAKRESELTTPQWLDVIEQAAKMGILHLHLTGGEPTLRDDVVELTRHARKLGLYTNLITSGVGVNEDKLKQLCDAGLDHVQLSFQDSQEITANEYAGTKAHLLKIKTAQMIRTLPLAFTLNIVIHRENISRLNEMIALSETLGADRIEIAHVQYYGWAFKNRGRLIPTLEQVKEANTIIQNAKERLKDKVRIDFVLPDYYAKFPKPCMGGWGKTVMLIDPAGRALPCHSAMVIPELEFDSVTEKPLQEIWANSTSFNQFRGEAWMKEPCSGCERKTQDFGGCRCQAQMLAGDASATDPVCSLSNQRASVQNEVETAMASTPTSWTYRTL